LPPNRGRRACGFSATARLNCEAPVFAVIVVS
jgi:hypothetical protein